MQKEGGTGSPLQSRGKRERRGMRKIAEAMPREGESENGVVRGERAGRNNTESSARPFLIGLCGFPRASAFCARPPSAPVIARRAADTPAIILLRAPEFRSLASGRARRRSFLPPGRRADTERIAQDFED